MNGEHRVPTWQLEKQVELRRLAETDQEREREVEDLQILHGHRKVAERHLFARRFGVEINDRSVAGVAERIEA